MAERTVQASAGPAANSVVSGSDGSGLSGATLEPISTPSRRRGPTGLRRIPGRRPMKEYPLTKGDMRDLAKTGIAATVCFSFSTGLFGFMINLAKDLSLAQGAPEKVVGFWNAIWWSALVGSLIFAVLGIAAILDGRWRLKEIEEETQHAGMDQ
jgi:hypothetical protein